MCAMKSAFLFVVGCVTMAGLLGCSAEDNNSAALEEAKSSALKFYRELAYAGYADTLDTARALEVAIAALVAGPSQQTLDAARKAWLAAREPYLQTEVFRFYDGPIDRPGDGPEPWLNAWPLDEAYIDYVVGDAQAGIINDPSVTLDAETLTALNETSETSISTGYHAIEFLLWGQDQSDVGPGARPYTDYVTEGPDATLNADRRGQYLTTIAALLVGHLAGLVAEWEPDADNYRAAFAAVDHEEGLRRLLTALIVLCGVETGGERLLVALDSGDQEDEHSCFSDNTHRDTIQDIQGLVNVWRGTYTRLDGSLLTGDGLGFVVQQLDAALAASIDEDLENALALAKAIQPPFDQEIKVSNSAGRARVRAVVDALLELEQRFAGLLRLYLSPVNVQ